MERLVEPEKVDAADSGDSLPTVDQLLSSSNWEKRVAAARVKREKVLAAKQANLKTEPADDDKTLPFLAAFVESEDVESAGTPAAPTSVRKMLAAPAPVAPVVPLSIAMPEPAKLESEDADSKRATLPLIACATAAGFAIALGAGIMIGKGLGDAGNVTSNPLDVAKADLQKQSTPAKPEVTEPTTDSALSVPKLPNDVVQQETLPPGSAEATPSTAELETTLALADVQKLELVAELNPGIGIGLVNDPAFADALAAGKLGGVELISPNLETEAGGPTRTHVKMTMASAQDASPVLLPAYLPSIDVVDQIIEPGTIAASANFGATVPDAFAEVSRITLTSFAKATELAAELPEFVSTSSGPVIDVTFAPPSLGLPADRVIGELPSAREDKVLAFAPQTALPPPATDPWSGVKTTPLQRSTTLAARLGFFGDGIKKVNLRLQAPNGLDQGKLDAQTKALEATGFALAKVARPGFNVSKSHLRYYNASDFEVAQAIASSMGFELRDFTSTKAPSGLVEVWLKGRAVATAKAKSNPVRSKKRRVDPLKRLRNNLASQLRNGDHL